MKPPPCQLAATDEVPVKRSRATITLAPGVPGLPSVADHDTLVWVTSCGCHEPVSVQIVLGFRASVTSATTGLVAPCITSTASAAAGGAEQVARIAAQAGTSVGLGIGEAVGDGLGVGLAEGVGLGLDDGEAVGLGCATSGPFAVQAATASRTPTAANPLTRD
jgi:hypothetical protein